jgi:hypothetical protein
VRYDHRAWFNISDHYMVAAGIGRPAELLITYNIRTLYIILKEKTYASTYNMSVYREASSKLKVSLEILDGIVLAAKLKYMLSHVLSPHLI